MLCSSGLVTVREKERPFLQKLSSRILLASKHMKTFEMKRHEKEMHRSDESGSESSFDDSKAADGEESCSNEGVGQHFTKFPERDVEERETSAPGGITTQADRWQEMYRRLVSFKEEHGHCQVPTRYKKDPKLGTWVAAQRQQAKACGCSGLSAITQERASKLKDIGFEWRAKNPRCVPWESRFKQLLKFVMQNGHANVPIGWEENAQLSNWVSAQRQEYKSIQKGRRSSKLNHHRINMLNRVGFVWEAQRGGLKRPRKGNHVPFPRSHEFTETSSTIHQMQAKTLLEVLDSDIDPNAAPPATSGPTEEVVTPIGRSVPEETTHHPLPEVPITMGSLPLSVPKRTLWNQPLNQMSNHMLNLSNSQSAVASRILNYTPLQRDTQITHLSRSNSQTLSLPLDLLYSMPSPIVSRRHFDEYLNWSLIQNQLFASNRAQTRPLSTLSQFDLSTSLQATPLLSSLVRPQPGVPGNILHSMTPCDNSAGQLNMALSSDKEGSLELSSDRQKGMDKTRLNHIAQKYFLENQS